MNRLLSSLLLLLTITACTPKRQYPPLVDPVDPRPVPVDPVPRPEPGPVQPPTPAPNGALEKSAFDPLVKGTTTLEQAHQIVGKGTEPTGKTDDQGVLWFYYVIKMPDGSAGDAVLGFTKTPTGVFVLKWKHVGY